MPRVKFTSALKRFFPTLTDEEFVADTVLEVMDQLGHKYPGILPYLTDESGALRKHVNIFVGSHPIQDRSGLGDLLAPEDELLIIQALSGG